MVKLSSKFLTLLHKNKILLNFNSFKLSYPYAIYFFTVSLKSLIKNLHFFSFIYKYNISFSLITNFIVNLPFSNRIEKLQLLFLHIFEFTKFKRIIKLVVPMFILEENFLFWKNIYIKYLNNIFTPLNFDTFFNKLNLNRLEIFDNIFSLFLTKIFFSVFVYFYIIRYTLIFMSTIFNIYYSFKQNSLLV